MATLTASRPATRAGSRALPAVLAACVLFVVALVPRLANLDQHATADEDLTLIRSANVALALEARDWWGTYQIGHPEATVQLLVALGLGADALRPYAGDFLGPDSRTAARAPGYFETLVRARALLTPFHAGLVVVAALLAWRLWGRTVGMVLGLLLALEPFLVAHGRILRTDALLAELLLVAVLAALVYWSGRGGAWALALCMVATALATLTKTPALALLGAVPAAAMAGRLMDPRPSPLATRYSLLAPRYSLLATVTSLAAWLAGSAVLAFALWPAMWARPLRALERMAAYTQEKGGSPMEAGGFFLGTPVADPGPLYYALALPLRISPVLLVGLLLWVVLRAPGLRRGVGLVLLIGVGLAVVLALLPKKADRYILPVIPFLAVVAAAGIAAMAELWRRGGVTSALGLVFVVETALLAFVWPYPLAAYNPLLGGARAADHWISVGWGEGLDQIAPVLNGRADGQSLTVSTPYPEVLQAQIAGRAVDVDAPDLAQYAVRYVAAEQRGLASGALDAALAGREPLRRVEIAGIPYAELYELERATFEGDIEADGVEVSPGVVPRRGWVTVQVRLRVSGGAPRALDVEAVLVNGSNPNDVEATVGHSALADGSTVELKMRAPNGLGKYLVGLSVRDATGGSRLTVASWPVGAPRVADRLVYPSLSVRVQ